MTFYLQYYTLAANSTPQMTKSQQKLWYIHSKWRCHTPKTISHPKWLYRPQVTNLPWPYPYIWATCISGTSPSIKCCMNLISMCVLLAGRWSRGLKQQILYAHQLMCYVLSAGRSWGLKQQILYTHQEKAVWLSAGSLAAWPVAKTKCQLCPNIS